MAHLTGGMLPSLGLRLSALAAVAFFPAGVGAVPQWIDIDEKVSIDYNSIKKSGDVRTVVVSWDGLESEKSVTAFYLHIDCKGWRSSVLSDENIQSAWKLLRKDTVYEVVALFLCAGIRPPSIQSSGAVNIPENASPPPSNAVPMVHETPDRVIPAPAATESNAGAAPRVRVRDPNSLREAFEAGAITRDELNGRRVRNRTRIDIP